MPEIEETFYPTVAFGFSPVDGRDWLHQLFVGDRGTLDWRPVPMIDMARKTDRPPAVAGFISEGGYNDDEFA